MQSKRLIVVLGMHRSGTSAITRGLQAMGVALGDNFLPPDKETNAKGFWEDADLVDFNTEILNAVGSDWQHLAPIAASDVELLRKLGYQRRAAELLRRKVGGSPVFGIKDPRMSKLLPFWNQVFGNCGFEVSYLMAVRNPLSVAKSLGKRDGIEETRSHLLWLGHVVAGLTGSQNNKRTIVDYDRLMQAPEHDLNRMAKDLDLEIDPPELHRYKAEFLDHGLRHTVYGPNDLLLDDNCPAIVYEVYTALLDAASEKTRFDGSELQDKIAHWAGEFEHLKSTLRLIDKILAQNRVAMQAVAERDGRIVGLNQAMAERNGQIAHLNWIMTERDGRIKNLNQALAERDGQIAHLNQAVAERDRVIRSLISSNSWRLTRPLRLLGKFLSDLVKIRVYHPKNRS